MSHKTKQDRRDEAVERQAKYDALTKDERLALLDERPGESLRERHRMAAMA